MASPFSQPGLTPPASAGRLARTLASTKTAIFSFLYAAAQIPACFPSRFPVRISRPLLDHFFHTSAKGMKLMPNTDRSSTAIHIENCVDVTLKDNRSVGFDVGIRAINSKGINATGNVAVSSQLAAAIAKRDPLALLEYMSIPKQTPPNLVQEAIESSASNFPDENAAVADLRRSRFYDYLGVGANLTTIVEGIFSVIKSGALANVRSIIGY
jgi:hypothetical protein